MLHFLSSPFEQFAAVMLLALVPAYILGRFLPSDSFVNGPFEGLTISFSGASALYVMLIVTAAAFITSMRTMSPDYVAVEINGRLSFDGSGADDKSGEQLSAVLHPSTMNVTKSGGEFLLTLTAPARRTHSQGFDKLPNFIVFDYPGFVSNNIDLRAMQIGSDGRLEIGEVRLASEDKLKVLAAEGQGVGR